MGLTFDEGVVDRLVEQVAGEPAALPLLQFTLTQLWENKERSRVTWAALNRVGEPREALARSAEEIYRLIKQVQGKATVLMVTHDLNAAINLVEWR